jgi:phosphatidylglycerophosphate synthase
LKVGGGWEKVQAMSRLALWTATLLRVALIPVFLTLGLRAQELGRAGADPGALRVGVLSILVVMGVSDLVDGWIARRYDLATQLGAVVDAFADKLVQVSLAAFFALSDGPAFASLPIWFLALVVGRDLVLGLGALVIRARHGPLTVVHKPHGKIASLSVFAVLFWVALRLPGAGLLGLLLLATTLNVVSATAYARDGVSQGRAAARASEDARTDGSGRRSFLAGPPGA